MSIYTQIGRVATSILPLYVRIGGNVSLSADMEPYIASLDPKNESPKTKHSPKEANMNALPMPSAGQAPPEPAMMRRIRVIALSGKDELDELILRDMPFSETGLILIVNDVQYCTLFLIEEQTMHSPQAT